MLRECLESAECLKSVVFLPDEPLVFIRELVPALPAPAVHHVPGLPGLDLVRALAEDRDLEAVQALAASLGSDRDQTGDAVSLAKFLLF